MVLMESQTVPLRKRGPAPKLSEERERELIVEYQKGTPVAALLLEFDISRPLLYKTLDKYGVPFGKSPRKTESPVDLAVERGGVVTSEGGDTSNVNPTPSATPGATAEASKEEEDV